MQQFDAIVVRKISIMNIVAKTTKGVNKMKLKFSYILALVLSFGVAWWMYSGTIIVSGQVDKVNAVAPPADRLVNESEKLFKVQVLESTANQRQAVLEINGRTESLSKIVVRAETSGILLERPIEKGTYVNEGDTLCEIDIGTKNAKLIEAQARVENAETKYNSATSLRESGFSTENQVSNLKADLDSAKARLDEAMEQVENTTIVAPVNGRIEAPVAEVGTFLNIGESCATILTSDPMNAVVQVSELDIANLEVGMKARVKTLTGIAADGTITYISHSADTDTRTFRVEVEVPNKYGKIRDGVSAAVQITLPPKSAHKINSSTLTLDDSGRIGVQTVNSENVVEFFPVVVSGGEDDGLWISGLPEVASVITVGQEYVVPGQKVDPVVAKLQ